MKKEKIIDILELTQNRIAYHPDSADKLKEIMEEAFKNGHKIVLDFGGISDAYFGFLDRAIGYFVKSYGKKWFEEKVKIQNANPVVLNMIENVVYINEVAYKRSLSYKIRAKVCKICAGRNNDV